MPCCEYFHGQRALPADDDSIHNIRGEHTALGIAKLMSPFGPSGAIAALLIPVLITRFPGHVILFAAMVAFFFGALMASITPPDGSYWAYTFPAMVVVVFGSGQSARVS